MGIDTIVNYPCLPKQELSTEGLLGRLKNRERARHVLEIYKEQGSTDQAGFEVVYRAADGREESKILDVQTVMQEAEILDELAPHCSGCPANLTGKPYGCVGYINYPISNNAEMWLLHQLPDATDPVLFLMFHRSIKEFGYTGAAARQLRDQVGVFFDNPDTLARRYTQLDVTTDVLFEMSFQLGPIQPAHGIMLLLFFNAIPRDNIGPDVLMGLMKRELDMTTFNEQFPFLQPTTAADDHSIRDLKQFMWSLYVAYQLDVMVLLDI
ncbi:MAG: hypothetical protein H6673_11435 [Anaerolineales bacterium]|nr:hypothetical protein [Anaerolineales bacterium]